MDPLIAAAAHALAKGDVLGALNWVALRDDAETRPPSVGLKPPIDVTRRRSLQNQK